MKTKKKKMYNWHFWVPKYEVQLVIEDSSFSRAKVRVREMYEYHNRQAPVIEFQFGQLV